MKRWTRFLLVVCMVLLLPMISIAARAADTSGTCGDNLTWTFDEEAGTLTIEGTGPMWDWEWDGAPWYSYRSSLKSVVIQNGITSIGDYAFCYCYCLTQVVIPGSVTSIGDYAFEGTSLTEVTIPDSVTSIGDYAFSNCDILIEVAIPDSVTSIGVWAFRCYSLTSITVDNDNPHYCSVDGVLFNKSKTILIQYPERKDTKAYTIPDSVSYIEDDAFHSCRYLTEVIIPNSVTYIGNAAFYSCENLSEVTIPDSVATIGDKPFYGCSSLTTITVNKGNTQYCSVDGVLFDKHQTTLIQYPAGKQDNTYTIPDSVITIGNCAFYHCNGLTEVTIGNSVTTIGFYAFFGCKSLTGIIIPDSVTVIGDEAFTECGKLTKVTIGNSVTVISHGTFFYCDSLTEVTIGNGVTSIGSAAFAFCSSLTQVTIPNSVTTMEISAFEYCDSLTDVYYKGTETQWDSIDIESYNDPLLSATIHYAFDTKTGAVSIPALPEGAESALIAAYADGKLVCAITGQVGSGNVLPSAAQADEIRIFYLGDNYQPVTTPDIIQLD